MTDLPLNQISQGDCVEVLRDLPGASVDLVFADPPYNLQLRDDLTRPDQTYVDAVDDGWDQIGTFADYDAFTVAWLQEAHRVMKDDATLWVIGSYHNIFRVGKIMMDLGFWVLNDVIWHKVNPMPNFRGMRFTNATETLIWARKSETQKQYTFNYHAMKHLNEGKQMQNVWHIPLCRGAERINIDGKKAHSTQKPEALLYRVILASSDPGDVILDPFFGTGTTGAVAKKLGRHFIGIEREASYIEVARRRIDSVSPATTDRTALETPSRRKLPRVAFAQLVETGYLQVEDPLYAADRVHTGIVRADGHLICDGGAFTGSIHKTATHFSGRNTNGWDYWHYADADDVLHSIDVLRAHYRKDHDLV
jgi:site-specific DNA-methyltransferase (adenine-specific)